MLTIYLSCISTSILKHTELSLCIERKQSNGAKNIARSMQRNTMPTALPPQRIVMFNSNALTTTGKFDYLKFDYHEKGMMKVATQSPIKEVPTKPRQRSPRKLCQLCQNNCVQQKWQSDKNRSQKQFSVQNLVCIVRACKK
ncbi:Hypothetical_protein [Hexamita inflata]|uniref:Hypothetical_protein n=1 Tax=Hexamita inflata TaxID=28002 RepID=A0AA86NH85_9EUKA|nr:Hypothetical protein HINF_LOCUS6928 [Hexamita inflata]